MSAGGGQVDAEIGYQDADWFGGGSDLFTLPKHFRVH